MTASEDVMVRTEISEQHILLFGNDIEFSG